MHPSDHVDHFFRRFARYWLAAIVLGAALGAVVANTLPPTYQGILTVTFAANSPLKQETAPFYLYDSYYALLAANREKSNYLAWLGEPTTVQATYAAANLTPPSGSAAELAKTFVALTSDQANSATITVSRPSDTEARALMAAVKATSATFPTAQHGLLFSDILTQPIRPSALLVTLGISLAAFSLVFVATFLVDLFGRGRQRRS